MYLELYDIPDDRLILFGGVLAFSTIPWRLPMRDDGDLINRVRGAIHEFHCLYGFEPAARLVIETANEHQITLFWLHVDTVMAFGPCESRLSQRLGIAAVALVEAAKCLTPLETKAAAEIRELVTSVDSLSVANLNHDGRWAWSLHSEVQRENLRRAAASVGVDIQAWTADLGPSEIVQARRA